jgi:5'-nucleotidase
MPYDLSNFLVIGVSSRALFDLALENEIFEREGLPAYCRYQLQHEDELMRPGTAFPLIRAILNLNTRIPGKRKVEVVVMSRNSGDTSLRIWRSIQHYGLDITRGSFAGGAPISNYLRPYKVDLFLSRDEPDVQAAIDTGVAAGLLYAQPDRVTSDLDQIRIAFDGDAVLFSDESERIYKTEGLDAFLAHEKANAAKPLPEGPFAKLAKSLSRIQSDFPLSDSPIRTALVTARNSPAHERAILTLRAWNVRIDESHFLGGVGKSEVLAAFGAHIFFDDQHVHCEPASHFVPSARVPWPTRPKLSVVREDKAAS